MLVITMYDGPRIIPERFWAQVQSEGECWIWTGGTTKMRGKIHGRVYVDGGRRQVAVQRIAYELSTGKLLRPYAIVKQRCGNLLCVNPNHLHVVRRTPVHTKLTPEQVIEMRERYAAGGVTYAELGRIYGVTRVTVWGIIKRKRWIDL